MVNIFILIFILIIILALLLCLNNISFRNKVSKKIIFLKEKRGGSEFTSLFSPLDVNKFYHYLPSLSIKFNTNDNDNNLSSLNLSNWLNKFKDLENKFILHKSQLDKVEWSKFKELDNLFRITTNVKNALKKEKTIPNSNQLSQAFFKMTEILIDCHLVSNHDFKHNFKSISAFHICEAPGQFIKAFQVYTTKHNIIYNWNAQSLKQTELGHAKNALGDIYGMISNNESNWLFGADSTGDISSYENILEYEQISKIKQWNVITSDCGIAFTSFNFQEEEIEFINYSQFLTMLLCLQIGGTCAMKIFLPLVQPIALYMHCLIFEHFEHVTYFKPSLNLTSSEIYICGKNYKGISSLLRKELLLIHKKHITKKDNFIFKMDIQLNILAHHLKHNQKYLNWHYQACNKMILNSIKCINKYLFFYYYMTPEFKHKLQLNLKHESQKWIIKYILIH